MIKLELRVDVTDGDLYEKLIGPILDSGVDFNIERVEDMDRWVDEESQPGGLLEFELWNRGVGPLPEEYRWN